MTIYTAGAEAFRDTTKWLVAFLPTATILTAGALVGPRLLADAARSRSLLDWAGGNGWSIVGIVMVLTGLALIVALGARVLSTQASGFTELLTEDEAGLSRAFSAGVGAPYFLDDISFRTAMRKLDTKWTDGGAVAEAELTRAVAATEMLREWALHRALAATFGRFATFFAVGALLVAGGLVVTVLGLGPAAGPIQTPRVVQVEVEEAGAQDLLHKTGCTDPGKTRFEAVAGTWDAPVLVVDGPGCKFGATWRPALTLLELRLPAQSAPNAGP